MNNKKKVRVTLEFTRGELDHLLKEQNKGKIAYESWESISGKETTISLKDLEDRCDYFDVYLDADIVLASVAPEIKVEDKEPPVPKRAVIFEVSKKGIEHVAELEDITSPDEVAKVIMKHAARKRR